jgi:hypothetical protein
VKIEKKILFVGGFLFFLGLSFLYQEAFPGHQELKRSLINRLSKYEPLPSASYESHSNLGDVIYVLGGSPHSLMNRFRTASDLYKNRVANKILIDDDQAMMEYRPSIGRNLTFNEWAVERLVLMGVRKEDIEPVPLESGFFGTFQEAKGISRFVLKRGYNALVLVTSSYHTERTWESFSKFIGDQKVNLYIYMANEDPKMYTLLKEYLKLELYKILLL